MAAAMALHLAILKAAMKAVLMVGRRVALMVQMTAAMKAGRMAV